MLRKLLRWSWRLLGPTPAPVQGGPVERADPRLDYYAPGAEGRFFLEERYGRCQPYIQGKKVLDIPCGLGWGTSLLTGWTKLYGADISEEALEFARNNYPGPEFIFGNMKSIPLSDSSIDVILCLEGYEHLTKQDQQLFIADAARVLNAGGEILINVPVVKSQNKFHLHEPTEDEFLQDVERIFHSVHYQAVTGPGGGREIFWHGRKLAISSPRGTNHP